MYTHSIYIYTNLYAELLLDCVYREPTPYLFKKKHDTGWYIGIYIYVHTIYTYINLYAELLLDCVCCKPMPYLFKKKNDTG